MIAAQGAFVGGAEPSDRELRAAIAHIGLELNPARAELVDRGLEIGEVHDVGGGVKYAWFSDPDGNALTLQEMPWRTGDAF